MLVFEPYLNGILSYIILCVWLLSLNTLFLRFSHDFVVSYFLFIFFLLDSVLLFEYAVIFLAKYYLDGF